MFAKTLILFVGVLAIASASDIFNSMDVDKIVEECAKENNVAKSEYNNKDILFSTPSENVLCMGKCLGEKMEIVDSDGTISKEKITEITSDWPEELQTAILECEDKIKKISSCDDVEEFRKCMQPTVEKMKKMYH